jgi:hypothetical protein
MEQLTNLDEYRRTKAGRFFGPNTLRGRIIREPQESIQHLFPYQRIRAVISEEWQTINDIVQLADVSEDLARKTCLKLIHQGFITRKSHERVNGPVLYRLAFNVNHQMLATPPFFDGAA